MTVDESVNTFYKVLSQHKEKCLEAMNPIMKDSDLAFAVGGLCYHLKQRKDENQTIQILNKWLKRNSNAYHVRLKGTKDQEERNDLQVTISELSYGMQKKVD